MSGIYYHSVTLDDSKCRGCTNCIKKCPTEAIRVRQAKANIMGERCIDCGECIRVCPYHAKKAVTDPFESKDGFKVRVALPAPSFYAQFESVYSVDRILTALKKTGFDEVFEVARGAEAVTAITKKLIAAGTLRLPVISSACPAVVRLIQVRYPDLIDNLLKLESPMEVAAFMARQKFAAQYGVAPEEVGICFISPCAAKVTSIKAPFETEKSNVDIALSMQEVYLKTIETISDCGEELLSEAGGMGIGWAGSGGEGIAAGENAYIAVDGIANVLKILDEIEDEKLSGTGFIELLACTGGCIGGPLSVKNPFISKNILKKHMLEAGEEKARNGSMQDDRSFEWTSKVEYRPVLRLDEDITLAMRKLGKLEDILKTLPGLDCGACGAPTCRSLAEDIVRGSAAETDCIFTLKDRLLLLEKEIKELKEK